MSAFGAAALKLRARVLFIVPGMRRRFTAKRPSLLHVFKNPRPLAVWAGPSRSPIGKDFKAYGP